MQLDAVIASVSHGIGIGSVNIGRSYDDATTSVIRSYLNIRYTMLPSIIAAGHAATCGYSRSTRVPATRCKRTAARCSTDATRRST